MKHAAAAKTTRTFSGESVASRRTQSATQNQKTAAARQAFMMAALNMSWQLAIVVLVPLLFGSWLDTHFGMSPFGIIVGFILAMVGLSLVVMRQLKLVTPQVTQADIDAAKKLRDQEEDEQ